TTAGEKLALRLSENDIRRQNDRLPDPPVLLETRIGMMVAAAEILCIWDQTDAIHEKIARPIRASLRDRPTAEPVVRTPGSGSSDRKRTVTGKYAAFFRARQEFGKLAPSQSSGARHGAEESTTAQCARVACRIGGIRGQRA